MASYSQVKLLEQAGLSGFMSENLGRKFEFCLSEKNETLLIGGVITLLIVKEPENEIALFFGHPNIVLHYKNNEWKMVDEDGEESPAITLTWP